MVCLVYCLFVCLLFIVSELVGLLVDCFVRLLVGLVVCSFVLLFVYSLACLFCCFFRFAGGRGVPHHYLNIACCFSESNERVGVGNFATSVSVDRVCHPFVGWFVCLFVLCNCCEFLRFGVLSICSFVCVLAFLSDCAVSLIICSLFASCFLLG